MPKMVLHPINLKKIPCPKQRTHTFVTCRVKKTSNESTKRIKKKKSNKIIVANKKGVKTQNAEHHT